MRPTTALASTLLFLTATLLPAQTPSQEPPPIEVEYPNVPKLLTPRIPIHADEDPDPPGPDLTPIQRAIHAGQGIFGNMLSVTLDVVVNQNGRVESAHATDGPERFFAQAEDIVLQRAFTPVRIDGNIVRARFQDDVAIYPREVWSAHPTPFPADPDLRTLTLSLQRTGCLGSCPSYAVTLTGSGDITFESTAGEGSYVAVPGIHRAHIPQPAVLDLLSRFRSANFLSAIDEYQCNWTDMPSQTLTLTLNGITKKVVDYGGSVVGLPDAIEALEATVDSAADTDRWVHGNANTLPALQSEHWNFSSPTAQNIALFNSTIARNDPDLLHAFLTAKAPILTSDPQLVSPICAASAVGNRDLVQQMLDLHPRLKPPQLTLDDCLSLSARSGSVPLVQLWLTRGARPTFPPLADEDNNPRHRISPPLIAAIQSGNPDVLDLLLHHHASVASKNNDHRALPTFALADSDIEDNEKLQHILSLLIAAGADINEETDNDRPAIFDMDDHPDVLPLLLKAGATPNQRDEAGKTPLMLNLYYPQTIKALLEAGADPTLQTPDGATALTEARKGNYKESIALLEAALKQRAAGSTAPRPDTPTRP